NTNGIATITVTVMDNGGTAHGAVDTVTRTLSVVVGSVNQPPAIDAISTPAPILENAGQQSIGLTGISPGPDNAGQTVTITASSNNTNVIPNPTVDYTSPQATGTLHYTPNPFTSGTATITVTVTNSGGTAN